MMLQNPYGRDSLSLDGDWHVIVDPYETGFRGMFGEENPRGFFKGESPGEHWAAEYDFANSPTLKVPGDWNSQREDLKWYEGTLWYYRKMPAVIAGNDRLFLRFGGANYDAVVWVNGTEVVRHVGGFTPFLAEVTDLLDSEDNFVVVKVDNRRLEDGVPTTNTDWWNCGGLTREVLLVRTPKTFIRDYFCQLDPAEPDLLKGTVVVDGDLIPESVTFAIAALGVSEEILLDDEGHGSFAVSFEGQRWSPDNPIRYEVRLSCLSDVITEQMGFRTVETAGEDILLNGKPVFLNGISLHEEALTEPRRAATEADARALLGAVKELGCNFARLAHYPHNDHMARVADELGLMLWCEIPVYWAINFSSKEVLDNASTQLSEMILRDRNRASVILWSVANETPVGEERTRFLTELVEVARALDPTRLTTAAMFMRAGKVVEKGQTIRTYALDDPLAEVLDVMGCNQYLGWYYTKTDDIPLSRWSSAAGKPLIMSEFGAAARLGHRGDPQDRWTEDYQVTVYRAQLSMMHEISFLRGTSPWILKDFRSPKRPLAGIQDYFNRKGLLSETGEKKLAWQTLADFYAAEDPS